LGISRYALGLAAVALTVSGCLAAPPVVGNVVRLAPAQDATMYSESGDLGNGAGEFMFSGMTAQSRGRRALLRFDVAASAPPGSMVKSVTLTLHVSQSPGSQSPESQSPRLPQPFGLHRVIAAWGEGASNAGPPGGSGTDAMVNDATWTYRFWKTVTWTTPGGDFNPAASASTMIPATSDEFITWGSTAAMAADVQDWLDRPANNFGWVLLGNERADKTARRFDSREHRTASYRPVLTIEFIRRGGGTSR
jgi:hypothetical protein